MISFFVKNKKTIICIMGFIIAIVIFAGIYPGWRDMWNNFGANLYHLFNN